MDAEPELLVTDDGGIRTVTLNRPTAANAITAEMREGIIATLAEASAQLAVRAVVITGAGDRHFCTGADLRAGSAPIAQPDGAPERPSGHVARMMRAGAQRLMNAVLDCEKPVIARVNGTAAGIGSHLALCCDLVVAADSAKFVEIFVRRGLVADGGGAWLLPRLIGLQRTKELLFFGDDLAAADAERLGLVNRVVPAGELDAAVAAFTERLRCAPTLALGLTKRLVNASLDVDRAAAFEQEAWAVEINMQGVDANEGVAAFVERREPSYRGW